MFRPRVIPVLLLKELGLVKSIKFGNYRYIGDPINAVKIFNDLKADELIFLDILASKENRSISLDFVERVGSEANMPFGVGGGISSIDQIQKILSAGAEKVILNTSAGLNPAFVKEAADTFGSSTIAISIDVNKKRLRKEQVYIKGGKKGIGEDPVTFAKKMEHLGAGELMITSITQDGTMEGYDLELIKKVSENVTIPVIACGGAGSYDDFKKATNEVHASAVAAGSLFVYHGPRRAVLINYPSRQELIQIFT